MTIAEEHDVIVVGAGVAGAALATSLARDGRRVLLIERTLWADEAQLEFDEPDRIVGELLQPGGYAALEALGLRDAAEEIDAQEVHGYALFLSKRSERISYVPPGAAPVAGRSFHNGRFLRRLRELANIEQNIQLVQGDVTALDKNTGGHVIGVTYRTKDERVVHARATLTIACDGCASRLRRRAAPDAAPEVYSQFIGMLLEGVDLPYPGHGHVVLASPAPMLFYQISSTHVRCLVDVPSTVKTPVREHLLNNLAPQLTPELRAPFEAAAKGNLRSMPNRVMPAAPAVVAGAVLLGDAFNMRHPLTGGGMTVALSDVSILRTLLRDTPDLTDTAALDRALARFHKLRKPLSTTINILANALYTLFCAERDPALRAMRHACVDYLASGGRWTHDPMGLIGGVKPHPSLLVVHFFSVALYGCACQLFPFPTPSRFIKAWDVFRAAFNVVKPLIDAENLKPLSWIPFSSL